MFLFYVFTEYLQEMNEDTNFEYFTKDATQVLRGITQQARPDIQQEHLYQHTIRAEQILDIPAIQLTGQPYEGYPIHGSQSRLHWCVKTTKGGRKRHNTP